MQFPKTIVFDFDGIFSDRYYYGTTEKGIEKNQKAFGFGARHALSLLEFYGYEFYVITGDSTETGREITSKFLSRLPIKEYIACASHNKLRILKKKFNMNEIIYVGDDLYDIDVFRNVPISFSISGAPFTNAVSTYNVESGPYSIVQIAEQLLTSEFVDSHRNPAEIFVNLKHQESFSNYINDKRFRLIFMVQQYSMRNHSDGKYNMLLDGNLNLTLHRLSFLEDKKVDVYITRPTNVDEEQLHILEDFIDYNPLLPNIKFLPIEYGINALDNRTTVPKHLSTDVFDNIESNADLIVSDFENYEPQFRLPYDRKAKLIYNFNISKVEELDRPYIDDFFDKQMTRIPQADYTYVLNENQRDYLIDQKRVLIDQKMVQSKVVVDHEQFNQQFLASQCDFFKKYSDKKLIESQLDQYKNYDIVFFPFRISDKCYDIQGVIDYAKQKYFNPIILTTDPNDSQDDLDPIVKKLDMGSGLGKKANYLLILSRYLQDRDMDIICFENPVDVLHQSLLEIYSFRQIIFTDKAKENYNFMHNAITKGDKW